MKLDGLVGADLSRTPPIYRPGWLFRYPDEKVKKHLWASEVKASPKKLLLKMSAI